MSDHEIGKVKLTSYFTGDLNEKLRAVISDHLSSCSQCRDYLEMLKESKSAFLSKYPIQTSSSSKNIHKFPSTKLIYAFAASLLLFVSVGFLFNKTQYPTERIKGETSLELYVQNSQGTIEKRDTHHYFTGERIQFLYSCAGNNFFVLLSIDQNGKPSVYFPSKGDISMPLEPGAGIPLPNSIVLDNYIGKELFIGIFSNKPFRASNLVSVLKQSFAKTKKLESIDPKMKDFHIEKVLITKQEIL